MEDSWVFLGLLVYVRGQNFNSRDWWGPAEQPFVKEGLLRFWHRHVSLMLSGHSLVGYFCGVDEYNPIHIFTSTYTAPSIYVHVGGQFWPFGNKEREMMGFCSGIVCTAGPYI